jgi:pimeloyl-ACP methyl ester carboxylesterase
MKIIVLLVFWATTVSCNSTQESKENTGEYDVNEKTFVQINGVEQGMFIKGKNSNAPVLLFLHGGPGMPEYGLTKKHPTFLEDYFTVCWWEQTGAGLSYNKKVKMENITTDTIISDTIEITNYLIKRFNKEKIYLMGHSYGTFIGLKTAYIRPDLYYAYIGVAQIVNQVQSEKIACQFMIDEYRKSGNKKMAQSLEKYNLLDKDVIPKDYFKFRDKPMHELGIGTMHTMKSVISGIFIPIMQNREYTFTERMNIWKAKSLLLKKTKLLDDSMNADFTKEITTIAIPVYFMHGIYDYTVNYSLAKEYYQLLESPLKGFYTFENSAHSPIFEEPEKVIKILYDRLTETAALTKP